jgi:hypothetical protein
MTGDGASEACAETVNLVGDVTGKYSGADINSSTSAADNLRISPLALFTESFRGLLLFSSAKLSVPTGLGISPLALVIDPFRGCPILSSGIPWSS